MEIVKTVKNYNKRDQKFETLRNSKDNLVISEQKNGRASIMVCIKKCPPVGLGVGRPGSWLVAFGAFVIEIVAGRGEAVSPAPPGPLSIRSHMVNPRPHQLSHSRDHAPAQRERERKGGWGGVTFL